MKVLQITIQCCLDNKTDTPFVILSETKDLYLSVVLRCFGGVYPDISGLNMTNNLN